MPIECDYYDDIPEENTNESFDLEQYEREGGKEEGIKREDISDMRREIGNLDINLQKARRNTKIGNIGIFCLFLMIIGGIVIVLLISEAPCPEISCPICVNLMTYPSNQEDIECEDGWIKSGYSLGLGCLWFEKSQMNYTTASDFCRNKDSHMVEVFTPKQLNFVANRLKEQGGDTWWGGGHIEKLDGAWVWKWTHSGKRIEEWIWDQTQPNGGDGDMQGFCFYGPYNYWGADWGYSGVADGVVCEKKKYQTKTSVRENNKTTASNKTHP